MNENINITIIPATYIGVRDDGNILVKCLQGNDIVNRALELKLFENIKNPKYLLIGIMTGNNVMGINVCDGSDFENEFLEKWDMLTK